MDLPPDLKALEDALAGRPRPNLPSALHDRVMHSVSDELALKPRSKRGSLWRFAAGVAAASLLWINLSMSAANNTVWRWDQTASAEPDSAAVAEVQELLPGCTESEARAHLLLLRARAQLTALPRPSGSRMTNIEF